MMLTNFLRRLGLISLGVILFGCSEQKSDNYYYSIFNLLETPERYAQQRVKVFGYLINDGGTWRLYPDAVRAKNYDFSSSIRVGTDYHYHMHCDKHWAYIEGNTLSFRGSYLDFNPEDMHYILSVTDSSYCLISDDYVPPDNPTVIAATDAPLYDENDPAFEWLYDTTYRFFQTEPDEQESGIEPLPSPTSSD